MLRRWYWSRTTIQRSKTSRNAGRRLASVGVLVLVLLLLLVVVVVFLCSFVVSSKLAKDNGNEPEKIEDPQECWEEACK